METKKIGDYLWRLMPVFFGLVAGFMMAWNIQEGRMRTVIRDTTTRLEAINETLETIKANQVPVPGNFSTLEIDANGRIDIQKVPAGCIEETSPK